MLGASEAPPEPYPLEYWALRASVSNVELSRDGTYMGLLRIPTRGANPIIEVYEARQSQKGAVPARCGPHGDHPVLLGKR